MPKLVKITTFMDDKVGRETAERELTHLINDGWEIITAGGGGQTSSPIWGFIVLVKNDPDAVVSPPDENDVQITY